MFANLASVCSARNNVCKFLPTVPSLALLYQSLISSPSPPPLLPLSSPSGSLPSPPPPFVQVSLSELKEALQNLLLERSERASQLEDMKRVTEAAKRERVLAIDEKDKLLSK